MTKEKYYNDVTNVEKARICSEINTKSILWGNIEGSYGTNHFITNRMRGEGGWDYHA